MRVRGKLGENEKRYNGTGIRGRAKRDTRKQREEERDGMDHTDGSRASIEVKSSRDETSLD